MGLYGQPNDWTCGPFALKHALVTLGQLTHERDISQVAHPHWWAGTNEVRLAKAARHFGCELPLIRRRDERTAMASLVSYVSRNIPVILCIDDWAHWVTVVRHERKRFVMIDSKEEPVLRVIDWPVLRRRWEYNDEDLVDDYRPVFDLLPVKPLFQAPLRASFSVERAQFLRRPENADLALHWDEYLEDLMEICASVRKRPTTSLSMGRFLQRHQESMVSRVTYWHGGISKDAARRVLRNFKFVAETYGLVIPRNGKTKALLDMTVLLSLWAASAEGIGPLYGADGTL